MDINFRAATDAIATGTGTVGETIGMTTGMSDGVIERAGMKRRKRSASQRRITRRSLPLPLRCRMQALRPQRPKK